LRKRVIDLLEGKLPPEELRLVPRSLDVVGDIAIMRVPRETYDRRKQIAEAVMEVNNHIRTVLCQVAPVGGSFRLRKLRWVLGEKKTKTTYREHGCVLNVDLARAYFSPRLAYERMRIAKLVKPGEEVVNMFAGVGSFSIAIAKHSEAGRIYSIDINTEAVALMKENAGLNRVEDKIVPMLGDARDLIEKGLQHVADRVLMPLPERAYEYLGAAILALKPTGGVIHYYDFVHADKYEDPIQKIVGKVSTRLGELNIRHDVSFSRVVRSVGPYWQQAVLDIKCSS